ncbi:MerR family transcriptional regulator [Candidatus Pelagibacter sp.]|uniref:MerR family transcriptional regulator n=1 Tax=Candidatus Pelagibacter sp. TaxID=2024849 RepID=UPI003F848932
MKSDNAYKTIGEVAKILGLTDDKKGTLSTHTIRFWEKEFKQIKPRILNGNRRYFDNDTIDLLKKIKFLLKDQGMTINGVKKILNSKESLPLDELANNSIKTDKLKQKLLKISDLIKNIKNIKNIK